ncbi:unnamed protein product [Blepharisma stoltei]|uniref:C2 domain-containing protein n=1 Tax=Blepharisma stoltei TaxID=1481888 RepID=A0AAU9ICX5_9CILI|nr:unnamed protein product [Blepharisma stoltei]
MFGKSLLKQRTISSSNFSPNFSSGVSFRLIEARLTKSVAIIGSMNIYAKVYYSNQIWESSVCSSLGLHPKWDASYHFDYSDSHTIQLILFHKAFLLGDTEIGRCTIDLHDVLQGHLTEWWDLLSLTNETTGTVLVSFNLGNLTVPEDKLLTTHSSNCSWDIRVPEFEMDFSPIRPSRPSPDTRRQLSERTTEKKMIRFSTEPDEVLEVDDIKSDLMEENERLRRQEAKVRKMFEKLKDEFVKMKEDKVGLKKSKESLQIREECIVAEKTSLQEEKERLEREKEEIEKQKEILNRDYLKLKQEKYKLNAKKKVIEKTGKQLSSASKQLEKQKDVMKKGTLRSVNRDLNELEDLEDISRELAGFPEDSTDSY